MTIKILTINASDYGESQELHINGLKRVNVAPLCECPEDAIIGRSLTSCDTMAALMREAYGAGKRGEEFELVSETEEWG